MSSAAHSCLLAQQQGDFHPLAPSRTCAVRGLQIPALQACWDTLVRCCTRASSAYCFLPAPNFLVPRRVGGKPCCSLGSKRVAAEEEYPAAAESRAPVLIGACKLKPRPLAIATMWLPWLDSRRLSMAMARYTRWGGGGVVFMAWG